MKTLYVSDLDATLLQSSGKISQYTCDTIHSLVQRGMLFSYATARSIHTAVRVTAGLVCDIPVIVYTGTFVAEPLTHRRIISHFLTREEINAVADVMQSFSLSPLVYSFIDGQERFSFDITAIGPGTALFVRTREGDARARAVTGTDALFDGEIFYFTFMDSPEVLRAVYDCLKDVCNCLFQPDNYTDNWFLEVMPRAATKANAAKELQRYLGADRLVAFGDGINDIELLKAADIGIAVANADDSLKCIADSVIGSCDDDGVARWLVHNYK